MLLHGKSALIPFGALFSRQLLFLKEADIANSWNHRGKDCIFSGMPLDIAEN